MACATVGASQRTLTHVSPDPHKKEQSIGKKISIPFLQRRKKFSSIVLALLIMFTCRQPQAISADNLREYRSSGGVAGANQALGAVSPAKSRGSPVLDLAQETKDQSKQN
jgi:hypothetical protein